MGVPQNFREAFACSRKAAEQGLWNAQVSVGWKYQLGKGVPADLVEAYKWFNLAAAQDANAISFRDDIMKSLTAEQIAEGQRRAAEFVPRKTAAR